jgi:type I restriction enzyme S subunit
MSSELTEVEQNVNALPEGWKAQPISRLCAEVADRVDPASLRRNLVANYVGLEHIGQGSGRLDGVGSVADVVSQKSRFQSGDILYGKLRPNLRKVARPTFDGVCSTDVIVLRANKAADPDFLFQVLQSEPLVAHAVATAAGTKMPRTHARSILSFEIAVPPLDEQRRIAEVLRSVDDAIAAKQAALTASKQFKRSCREAAVQRFHQYPASALQAVLTSIDAGWSPDCDSAPADAGEWSILKTSAVVWEGYDDSENKRLPARFEPRTNLEVAIDDILITRAGPAERTGVIAIVRQTAGQRMLSDKIMRLRVSPERGVPLAIAELLSSEHVQSELARSKSGMAASQTNISQKIVLGLKLHLPPLADQRDFANEMAALQDVIERNEYDLRRTRLLKADLMFDLLSGRVRVPARISSGTSVVPAAFKRAVFAAEIVHQLHNDNRFGSVKHEKIVHLCELHLDLHNELDRRAYKQAAGPYDPVARRSVEQIFRQQKWFGTAKPDGMRVVYSALEKAGDHRGYFDSYFGEQKASIQAIIDLLRPLDTERCEMIATAYAVWNDFIIECHQPSDQEIVASILAWHPRKARISADRWAAVLPWMRQHGLVPRGTGEKTRTVSI